ncbi:MAG: AMP-dependent synthetase and ligase [Gammaproteobacteria bacterium]|nr:AMP-dependent synthetase and ligase [Gammaproteobacteria bacterium]
MTSCDSADTFNPGPAGERPGDEPNSPWLPGGYPAPGRVARARIRNGGDIETIEAVTPADVLPSPTIYECIRAASRLNPLKTAVVHLRSADSEVPPRTLTYAQLLDSIERAASLFRDAAPTERSSVGIILPMVPEALIAAWAGATAGIANPINPYLQLDHVTSLLNASRVTVLVVGCAKHGRGAWERLTEIVERVPTLRRVLIVDSDDPATDFAMAIAARPPGLSFKPACEPDSEATYLATGGTTAAPKLVRMTHRGQLLMAWLIGAHAGAAQDDVIGHAMPNFHVGGANLLTLRAILYGQTVVTLTIDGFRNSAIVQRFWSTMRRYRVTSLIATPATAAAILAQPEVDSTGHAIRIFNCGGSTIPVDVLRGFHERFGVWLREVWGMSEFHGMVSIHPDLGLEPMIGSVGRAVPWHRIKVVELDAENRFVRECAPGERGVLVVSGAALVPGYVDTRFDADFFVTGMPDGERWGNTGDLGTMDERGYVWIFGRAKDVIIRGGHNIDPKLIEDVLVHHPAVQIAAAIGRPDPAKGEMPIAYVQLKPDAGTTVEELLALCRAQVQERAAVPVEILIVPQIPVTAVGKINKPVLRAETMVRVAREQAAAVVGERGTLHAELDESGVRPRVRLEVSAATGDVSSLRNELQAAFCRYEFQTVIFVEAAKTRP